MNEQKWLTSGDPSAMLEWLDGSVMRDAAAFVTCRKLRLWVEACREAEGGLRGGSLYDGPGSGWDLDTPAGLRGAVEAWRSSAADGTVPTAPARAALLRDVVGNPFRPQMELYHYPLGHAPFLTETVLSVARASYENRLGRKCDYPHKCSGLSHKDGCNCGSGEGANSCPLCHGTGRVADGTLDPDRLLVLADALEEAGACCPRCDSWGIDTLHDGRTGRTDHAACPDCGGTGSHPAAAHLRSPGPHVRGCWALGLILGEE